MGHYTYDKLYEGALASGDKRLLEEYSVLKEAISKNKYSWFFSLTTPTPMPDPIDAERCCVKIYDRVTSTLYGRRKPEIPFVSFIEQSKEQFKGMPNHHIHLLIGEADSTHIELQNFPANLKKTPRAIIRKMGLKIRYGFNGKGNFRFPIHEERVYEDAGVIDYLLKGIRNQSYRICYHASNIDFGGNCDSPIAI